MALQLNRLHKTEERLELQIDEEVSELVAQYYDLSSGFSDINNEQLETIQTDLKNFIETDLNKYSILISGFYHLLTYLEELEYEMNENQECD